MWGHYKSTIRLVVWFRTVELSLSPECTHAGKEKSRDQSQLCFLFALCSVVSGCIVFIIVMAANQRKATEAGIWPNTERIVNLEYIHTYIHTRRGRTRKENRRLELGKETKKKKRGGRKTRPRIKKKKKKKKKEGLLGLWARDGWLTLKPDWV